jgi:polyvinyl alcohol dehydrogenase (cytochrome)
MAFARGWVVLALTLLAACDRDAPPPAPAPSASKVSLETIDGAALYMARCAGCHDGAGAVVRYGKTFKLMRPETVMAAMDGVMAEQARPLNGDQKAALAEFVTNRKLGDVSAAPAPVMCAEWQKRFDFNRPPPFTGGGLNATNTRLISPGVVRLGGPDLQRLAVKWAFAFPGATRARAQPTIGGGAVYVGSEDGTVYALDEDSGCLRWSFRADAEVRGAAVLAPWVAGEMPAPALYVGDEAGNVYRIDAATGQQVWKIRADTHAYAAISGSPALHDGRLYVPVASNEWIAAADPDYECCTFRGSVVALDTATGARLWQSWMIGGEPHLTGNTNAAGTPVWQPAGASIWGSPAVDARRKRLYVATGAATTSPASHASDAVVALDMETGRTIWRYQATAGDAWTLACQLKQKVNCPAEHGPAFDFSAPPVLVAGSGGRDMVLAGQKSGYVHALDAETGNLVWRQKLGRGGFAGGIHWGMAADARALYVPIADTEFQGQGHGERRPGLFAMDPATGEQLWFTASEDSCPATRRPACDAGLSAAITALPGAVLAGGYDGWLRAYDSASGQVIWSFDTTVPLTTISGETAHGGSLEGGGPLVADGKLFITSGSLYGGRMPGNVLIVLAPGHDVPEMRQPLPAAAVP